MFWSQNTKWQRARETMYFPSQIQNAKTLKINGTLKMKTGIKKASTFWDRFVAILKNKTVVSEALKIERGMNIMKFDSFENNMQRKRQVWRVSHVFGIIRTA